MVKNALVISVLLALCGCAGPKVIMTAEGPNVSKATNGPAKVFSDSAATALASVRTESEDIESAAMRDAGYSLIYANCSDFFATAGNEQKWILFSRDLVGALGTLGTSVIALRNYSERAVANLALSTTAVYTGLDIYTKNFLFSAENVASVRTLVLNALQVHRKATQDTQPVSYGLAAQILFDHQHICSPEKILALVRNAIARGEVVSSSSQATTDAAASAALAIDQAVLQRLGNLLNPPGALTMDQAGALFWLLRDFATIDQRKSVIAKKLEGLPSSSVPVDSDGNYKSPWALEAAVKQELGGLSAATIASIKSEIDKQRAAKASSGNESSIPLKPFEFRAGRPRSAGTSGSVSVDIK